MSVLPRFLGHMLFTVEGHKERASRVERGKEGGEDRDIVQDSVRTGEESVMARES